MIEERDGLYTGRLDTRKPMDDLLLIPASAIYEKIEK